MDDALQPERPESLVGVNPFVWSVATDRLMWFPEAGYGYFECDTEGVYTSDYFDRYAEQAEAPIGQAIMAARVALVKRFAAGTDFGFPPILDVGIGSGAFLQAWWDRAGADGFGDDVNPAGVAWLDERGKRRRLASGHDVVTFWDVLEHIRRPDEALAHVKRLAFVSLPIFRDVEHLMGSKHRRYDEHFHYWTRKGFIDFAQSCGFKVVECNAMETLLGRDEIETFVLERVEWL
jgi:hypothetical protein